MFYQTEAKFQGWRALAVLEDRSERLIFVGRSTTQVRGGYAAAFAELLDDEERGQVRSISLQCWDGAPDKGRWVQKSTLSIPAAKGAKAAQDADQVSRILAFRKPRALAESAECSSENEPARLATTA